MEQFLGRFRKGFGPDSAERTLPIKRNRRGVNFRTGCGRASRPSAPQFPKFHRFTIFQHRLKYMNSMKSKAASSVSEPLLQVGDASVVAVMVRTRAQTPEAYLPSVQVEQWETPLVEVRLAPSDARAVG